MRFQRNRRAATIWGIAFGLTVVVLGLVDVLFSVYGGGGIAGASGAGLAAFTVPLSLVTGVVVIVAGILVAWRY